MTVRDLLLGIDLGTSAVKVCLFDRMGTTIVAASHEYTTLHPESDFAEQEPSVWWDALCRAVRSLLSTGDRAQQIRAIGLSGQMHGAVLLQSDGRWSNAIIWQDRRSARQAERIREELGAERLIEIGGSPIAAGFQAATLRWLEENDPARLANVANVLLPKDWLGWRLTGEIATDPSDAAGTLLFDTRSGVWNGELADAARVRREILPPIRPSSALRGGLTTESARELGLAAGTPVVVGAADAACALLAAGGVDESTFLLNLSTGGQLVQPLSTPRSDSLGRLHTFRSALTVDSGAGWYLMGATLAAGFALRWWREQCAAGRDDLTYDTLVAPAAEVAPGCDGLLFLPYLVGERTPHMDPLARGAFLGLRETHTQAHMTRAILEGATFAVYEAYCAMQEIAPTPSSVTLAGGGGKSLLWRQMVADIFGLSVRPLLVHDQSAWGAALLAGEGIGWWDARTQAVACAALGEETVPDADAAARYAALFPLFQHAYRSNRDLFAMLGGHESTLEATTLE